MNWNNAEITRLKELHAEGALFRIIGKELGKSRSAVIGMAHRIGLPARIDWEVGREDREKAKQAKKERQQNRQVPLFHSRPGQPEIPVPEDLAIPLEQRKKFLELTDACCHWPVGDPKAKDFFFCGAMAEDGRPYCKPHLERAHVPSNFRGRR